MIKRYSIICTLVFIISISAHAEMLTYSSGTGFFINRDGYILTNNHVVKHCGHITLSGPLPLTDARLVARDEADDLALLKADTTIPDAASLNSEKQPLRTGDPVVIVGYPGQSWETGKAVTATANIINTKGPRGEEKWLQFSDALAQGNSGGPLLDEAGNVVGVVAAKAHLIMRDTATGAEETVSHFDIAVSLPAIRHFLDDQRIEYQEADSGIYVSPDGITDKVRRFVVNVRCKYEDK